MCRQHLDDVTAAFSDAARLGYQPLSLMTPRMYLHAMRYYQRPGLRPSSGLFVSVERQRFARALWEALAL